MINFNLIVLCGSDKYLDYVKLKAVKMYGAYFMCNTYLKWRALSYYLPI